MAGGCLFFLKADGEPTEQQKKLWPGEIELSNYDTLNPLAVINAIDGTVIDPYAGY